MTHISCTDKYKRSMLAGSLLLAGVVSAQAQGAALEEIIVTAQKRAEDLQEVPLSIAAFSEQMIENKRIANIGDIAGSTPNFNYSVFGGGRPEFTIRGIGTTGVVRAGLDNAVITFVDEVYVSRSSASTFELFDLEQVSVLRGPQGTLFGKNVVGGAVSITTKKPSLEGFEGKVKVGGGNYGLRDLKAYVNGPFSDALAGKLTVSSVTRDGFGHDTITGQELDDMDSQSVRGQLLFDPGEDLTILFTAETSEDSNNGGILSEGWDSAITPTDDDIYTSSHGVPQKVEIDQDAYALTVNLDTSFGTLTSITAYRDVEMGMVESFTAEALGASGAFIADVFLQGESDQQLTQEIRLASDSDGAFNWVAGAYFINEEIERLECEFVTTTASAFGFLNGFTGQGGEGLSCWAMQNETDGWAVFWDGSYALSDTLAVRAGFRYTDEDKDNRTVATAVETFVLDSGVDTGNPRWPLGAEYDVSASDSFSGFTPRVVLEWQAQEDMLVYASVSKGFKSGGFDGKLANAAQAATPFKEEKATSYEIGLKSQWLDNSLQFNAAYFDSDFEDMQRLILIPTGGLAVVNAAEADVKGFEADLVWLPTDSLEITAAYGYLDAVYGEFVWPNGTDLSNQTLPNAPKNKYSLGISYNVDLSGGGSLRFYGDYNYTAAHHFNREDKFQEHTGSYDVLSANLTYTSSDEQWAVTLWGKNLADEEYYVKRGEFFGQSTDKPAAPRTYGATVSYSF